jgi:hypothetical protein
LISQERQICGNGPHKRRFVTERPRGDLQSLIKVPFRKLVETLDLKQASRIIQGDRHTVSTE